MQSIYCQSFMSPFSSIRTSIIGRHLPISTHRIFIYAQTFQTYRSSRVDLIRTDSDFRPEAKSHPIRHTGARVPENARTVNRGLELLRNGSGGCKDGIGMVRRMSVYMRNGEREENIRCVVDWGGDRLDCEYRREEFGVVVIVRSILQQSRFLRR